MKKSACSFVLSSSLLALACSVAIAAESSDVGGQMPPTLLLDAPPRLSAPTTPDRIVELKPLQRLVRLAVERSPLVREALAKWRAAEEDVHEAEAALYPQVALSANSAAARLESQEGATFSPRAGVNVAYNVLDYGKRRSAIRAKRETWSAEQARVTDAQERAAFETANAYVQWIKNERLIGVYDEYIHDLRLLVSKLAEIVAVFPGRRSELTQAEARLGLAQGAVIDLRAKRREAQLALMRQVGIDVSSAGVPDTIPAVPDDLLAGLLSQANRSHPAVLAARGDADAARAEMEQARASHMPQIDLQLTKQMGRDQYGIVSPAQVYVVARWDAFQGFGDRAREQALLERARAADERLAQAFIEIEFRIRGAQADADIQRERLKHLGELVKRTDQVRQDFMQQWRELGRRTLLDVLTAESEHLNTRLGQSSSEADLALARLRMRYEAGALKAWLLGEGDEHIAERHSEAVPVPAASVVLVAPASVGQPSLPECVAMKDAAIDPEQDMLMPSASVKLALARGAR